MDPETRLSKADRYLFIASGAASTWGALIGGAQLMMQSDAKAAFSVAAAGLFVGATTYLTGQTYPRDSQKGGPLINVKPS